jgi:hypothetical protein
MIHKLRIVLALALTLVVISCSKKQQNAEPKYTAEEFMALAHEAQPSNEKGEGALKLSDYSSGVNRTESRALKYNRLTFFAVEFATSEEAKSEALRLNQYYTRNWLLDHVEGEPILEDYVIETFKASNPRRHVQRVPKKHEAVHSEAHGEAHGEAAHH